MIKKTTKGYQVVSEKGRPLSEPDMPYKQAEDRLNEIEFFKRVNQAKDEGKKMKKTVEPKPKYGITAKHETVTTETKLPLNKHGQNDPDTIEEMEKRYKFQKSGYKSKVDKTADEMSEGEKKVIDQHFKKKVEMKKTEKELPPVKHFENLKSKLDVRHQKALNKVLGKYD